VKCIDVRATLISLFLGLAVVTAGRAEDYYIYYDRDGKLVISNKQPPPGSKIIKQQNLLEPNDSELPQSQQRNNPQPNGQAKSSPKESKTN
jgi:hypothetical protein